MRAPLSLARGVHRPRPGRHGHRRRRLASSVGRPGGGGDPRRRHHGSARRRARPRPSTSRSRRTARRSATASSTSARTARWRPRASTRRSSAGPTNFEVGDLVVVVLPGAVLAGGFEIAARRTYGRISNGMICAEDEIGIGHDHTGIIVLSRSLGEEQLDAVQVGDDAIALLGPRARRSSRPTSRRTAGTASRCVVWPASTGTPRDPGRRLPRPRAAHGPPGHRRRGTRSVSPTPRRSTAGHGAATGSSRGSSAASTRPGRRRRGCSAA